ncbi:hypothetical protein AYI70_g2833, partial [Smittium culicis]
MKGSSSKKRRNIENSTVQKGKDDKIIIFIDDNDDNNTPSHKLQGSKLYQKIAPAPIKNPSTSIPQLNPIASRTLFPIPTGPYFAFNQNEYLPAKDSAVSISTTSHDSLHSSVGISNEPVHNSEPESISLYKSVSFTEDQLDEMIDDAICSKRAEGSRMAMLLNCLIFKKSIKGDRSDKLTVHLSDILHYFLENDYGLELNLDFRFYKLPGLEYWNRHRRSLWLYGDPTTGKKSFAMSLFKNPLVVYELNDIRKLSKYFYDGIIFCNISFLHIDSNEQHILLSVESHSYVCVDEDIIRIPYHTPR